MIVRCPYTGIAVHLYTGILVYRYGIPVRADVVLFPVFLSKYGNTIENRESTRSIGANRLDRADSPTRLDGRVGVDSTEIKL